MKFRVLSVLMWKHLVVKKRSFILTTVELISPIFFIVLLFMFRNEINPIRKHAVGAELENVEQPDSMPFERASKPSKVLFTPDTEHTKLLMEKVSESLKNSSRRTIQFTPYKDPSDFENETKVMSYDEAIVIFYNMSNNTWPETLNYTIRMKSAFMTHLYDSLDGYKIPHSAFGIIYEPFMSLQWAIDMSYLQLLTGNEIKQKVTLQEFPYVRRLGNAGAEMVCQWMKPLCFLSLLLTFVSLMSRLLQERASGIQELMKMMGVSTSKLTLSHVLAVLLPGLVFSIVSAVLLTASSNPLLKASNGFLLFVAFLLYYFTIISMAFVCSYLITTTQYAVSLAVLTYVGLWLPASFLIDREIGRGLALVAGVLPHQPMIWVWKETEQLEKYGQGLTFATVAESHSITSGSALAAFFLMLLQTAFFFVVAWYLDRVKPGKFGQALPWNFFCQRNYWRKNDIDPNSELEELEESVNPDARYFEPAPPNLDVGIRISNVTKIFPKQRALSNVSLDVHKGEITVLLGHNGAGKTTLMSIITGMLSSSSGQVSVGGADVHAHAERARRRLGLCPQHNMFFADLTVLEHVMFFTLLKVGSFADARRSSEKLLDKLGILDKKNEKSVALSGGMKRRLQLACALAGDADVLILDEPTSGLDVETRRELWDLLLSLRGNRTVLLSTHFMEEADALGDRVAALHGGRLRCYATPLYLKKAIGTGYRLTFTTIGLPKEAAITSVVTSHVPDATVKETSLNSMSYSLPATRCDKFPGLFSDLEYKRSELGIDSIGVGASTLEEVFLRLCSDVDTTFHQQDEVDGAGGEIEHPQLVYASGAALYLRQFLVLLKRQLNYILAKKSAFFVLELFLPILMIVLIFYTYRETIEEVVKKDTLLPMDLDIYNTAPGRRVLLDVNGSDESVTAVTDSYPKVLFQRAFDINDAVLRSGKDDILEYNKYVIGVELNDTDAKVLYTTTVRHAAPVALNFLSNLIASRLLPWANGRTIVTSNHPVEGSLDPLAEAVVQPKTLASSILCIVTVVFIILATGIHAVSLPCKERLSGARHLHVMAGAAAGLHWAATLVSHAAVALATLILPTALAAAILDRDHTFNDTGFIVSLSVTLLLGCLAFFALAYLISFYFGEHGSSFLLVLIIVVFGLILPLIKSVSDFLKPDQSVSFTDSLLILSSYVVPPHSLTVAASESALIARLNALCELNRDKCPNLMVVENGFDVEKCCGSTGNAYCYFCMDKAAPGPMMLCLTIQFVCLMTLLILTERGVFKALYEKVMNSRYTPPARSYNDEMARAERAYVTKAIALPTRQIPDAMLVSELHKNYKLIGKSCNAVKGISFSVKKGECFGLLGVNGAGKSSTFKVLTGEEWPTRGQVMANGCRLQGHTPQYLRSLGYCPQFFGLDEFQTGYENLALLLTLRGLNASDVKAEANSWIKIVGLEKYAHRAVSGYSGGCVRRLAAAAALCRGAALALLDEPTAGVDVAARRRVWAALRRGLARRRAVVITSHSMDEMEALCGRIGIMCGGEVCALGSPAGLRAAHAAGHALVLRVAHETAAPAAPAAPAADVTDSGKSQIHQLKGMLNQKFNCTLKDEHKTMLHYHINETMQYSDLFQELEALKASFSHLVQDYSVTETTLEEVFLSFARNAPETDTAVSRPV